jgi:glycosyltransferase involved in cell wall biosynthesis
MSGTALLDRDSRFRIPSPAEERMLSASPQLEVGLLTGGQDRHYAFGLAMALIAKGMDVDVIGSDLVDGPEMHITPRLRFLNLYGSKREATVGIKIKRFLISYARLIRYAATAQPKVFHILWNNRFELFDRTLLMLLYKLLGRKVVVTAHNVNAGRRDSKDSPLNRLGLRFQYRLADHIFVHTQKMKNELLEQFRVREGAITTIPYGLNNAVADTDLTPADARKELGIRDDEKVILFFGAIKPYKGLEYLVAAFQRLATTRGSYRLIVAGERKKGYEEYFDSIRATMDRDPSCADIIQRIEFIPDDATELYFKAADVAALPYTEIFQSGILFLAFSFGLPVIATDVGSFRDDVIEGETGFVCKACDAEDLAASIRRYFESDLFRRLPEKRAQIRERVRCEHSWDTVGSITRDVYLELTGDR